MQSFTLKNGNESTSCARCGRDLTRPVWINGKSYGSFCASRITRNTQGGNMGSKPSFYASRITRNTQGGNMGSKPNYAIVESTAEYVLLRDLGPWDKHLTITNGAEDVVAELAHCLNGRRLEYIDSDGRRDQLLVEHGQFAGFAPVDPVDIRALLEKEFR